MLRYERGKYPEDSWQEGAGLLRREAATSASGVRASPSNVVSGYDGSTTVRKVSETRRRRVRVRPA